MEVGAYDILTYDDRVSNSNLGLGTLGLEQSSVREDEQLECILDDVCIFHVDDSKIIQLIQSVEFIANWTTPRQQTDDETDKQTHRQADTWTDRLS